ncbi:MAG: response regulator [Alphaproteobacteria bacterium]|nr:response regulator [Alphaproteobacteria bacterium]
MKTCLVVDDVAVTRFSARSFLDELGLSVVEAEDEKSALASLEESPVDVVLLDWHLKKKSGLELLEIIREKHGHGLKVVVFSGVENEGRVEEAKRAGADGFITKPTTREKIESEFKRIGAL